MVEDVLLGAVGGVVVEGVLVLGGMADPGVALVGGIGAVGVGDVVVGDAVVGAVVDGAVVDGLLVDGLVLDGMEDDPVAPVIPGAPEDPALPIVGFERTNDGMPAAVAPAELEGEVTHPVTVTICPAPLAPDVVVPGGSVWVCAAAPTAIEAASAVANAICLFMIELS